MKTADNPAGRPFAQGRYQRMNECGKCGDAQPSGKTKGDPKVLQIGFLDALGVIEKGPLKNG
jgi:hypothetical protein